MFYAFNGFGPNDYVNQKMFPGNFQKDFLGLSLSKHYDRSLIMKTFYWAKIFFNLDPDKSVFVFIFFQCLFFICALFFLLRSFKVSDYVIFLYLIPVLILSNLAGVDFSRFGAGFGSFLQMPLYYGWSIASSFLALAFSIRQRYIKMFLCLAISCLFHVTIGALSFVFVCSYYLLSPQDMKKIDWLKGTILFGLIFFLHLLFNLGFGENIITTGEIKSSEWIKMTKIFCHHWYPLSMKMFTVATYEFYSFVTLIFLSISSFSLSSRNKGNNFLKILVGLLSCVVMILIGILFSDIYPIPTVIKISPQRSSSLVTFVLMGYYSFQVSLRLINSHQILSKLIPSLTLVYMVFPGLEWGFRLVGLVTLEILTWLVSREKILNFDLKKIRTLSWLVLCLIGCFAVINLKLFKINHFDLMIISLLLMLLILIYLIIKNRPVYLYLSIVIWVSGLFGIYQTVNRRVNLPKANDFIEIQKWARFNTDSNSLFAVDPTHSYAWRDYSARSSYGTFRDWGFVGFAYDSNYDLYLEGKRRAKLFGVDFDKISAEELQLKTAPIWSSFKSTLQKKYYSFSKFQLKKLSIEEKIDYFVFEKMRISKEISSVQPAFQNGHYLLIKSSSL